MPLPPYLLYLPAVVLGNNNSGEKAFKLFICEDFAKMTSAGAKMSLTNKLLLFKSLYSQD